MNAKARLFPTIATVCVVALAAAMVWFLRPTAAPTRPKPADAAGVADMKMSGPYTHENLAVFLIHGPDRIEGEQFLTLREAMEQKTLIVHETGDVNELMVENRGDLAVYIHPGDIVKGGRQDRMIPHDCIVPPNSGRKPISTFCVERGRWTRRGDEDAEKFSVPENTANNPRLLTAARLASDQGAVWEAVAEQQNKLSVVGDVTASYSPSSLQLSLENEKLQAAIAAYKTKLESIVADSADAVGFAVVVNGEVQTVDVYASHALFEKLWPKLLEAGVVSAIARKSESSDFAQAGEQDIRRFVRDLDEQRRKWEARYLAGQEGQPAVYLGGYSAWSSEFRVAETQPFHSSYIRTEPDSAGNRAPLPETMPVQEEPGLQFPQNELDSYLMPE